MKGTPNVIRRGGKIHFRRGVPKHLVERIGRRELVVSLSTSDIRLGRLRSRQVYIASEMLFATLEMPMLSAETIERIVAEFYVLVGQIDDLSRLSSPAMSASAHQELQSALGEHSSLTKAELGRGDYTLATLAAEVVIQRLALQVDDLERRQAEQAIMRTGIETTRAAEAKFSGEFDYSPGDSLVRSALQGDRRDVMAVPVVIPTARSQHQAAMPHSPVDPADLFDGLTKRFLAYQAKGKLWDPQTVAQAKKTYALWQEVCGNLSVSQYARPNAQHFKEVLQDLPWDYGKAAEFRGKTLTEIGAIDGRRQVRVERLSTRTVKRHFAALSGLWKWAIGEKLASDNLFVGFSFPSMMRANEQRDMWTTEELTALFATPVWTGCLSAARRSTPGALVIQDEKYWLPLIAILSGLRQEEAAQLHLADIRRVEGHLIFDINPAPPRMLKNRNAVRKVPIHSSLIRHGLLDYVRDLRTAGEVVLFPNLKPGGADGRRGHAFSKWFTRYRKHVGLYRHSLDFHSLRHSATTFMQRAGVPLAAIDELTGHATPGETARYSHGLMMQQLVDAIESIKIQMPMLTASSK